MRRLNVLLIKPSKYDDEGYVMRYLRGVLPSNTLATMAGLTREVALHREVGRVRVVTKMLDETVQRIDPKRLARKFNRPGERAVVALCGKKWIPNRDPERYPICQTCADIRKALFGKG